MNLSQYKGKTVLVVNIATRCGYTKQLEGLEKLYKKYKEKGLVVLGVPSNDFGSQTPESDPDVKKFCLMNYGVSFPITSKVKVLGKDKEPLIAALLEDAPKKDEIAWNFEKFLVNSNGKVIKRFPSSSDPQSEALIAAVEAALNQN